MKNSLSSLFIGAIFIGAILTFLAQFNGYISNTRLKQFDAWLCQQSWFESQAQCKVKVKLPSKIEINLDELVQRSVTDKSGNWKVDYSPENEARAITEIIAIRLLIELQKLSRNKEISVLSNIYARYWPNYPEFIAASRCVACGSQRSLLRNLGNSIETKDTYLKRFALSSPEMLPLIAQDRLIDDNDIKPVTLMAELLYNGGSHSLISPTMVDKKDWASLSKNIINGGAYGALSNANLNEIPESIVIQAWERAMSDGKFEVKLTQHLLLKGYRPALRLIVWLQAGNYDYLKYSQAKNLALMLSNHSDFGYLKGQALADYYSQNWRKVRWNSIKQQWTSN